MDLDQIYEQNNKLIKECVEATDLLNKVDGSDLIRWETCSPKIVRVVLEDCHDRNKTLVESSTKHNESSQPFKERFPTDVNRILKYITPNPCMQDHLTKLSNKSLFESLWELWLMI